MGIQPEGCRNRLPIKVVGGADSSLGLDNGDIELAANNAGSVFVQFGSTVDR
jgi:hypothetical protein